jgi:hypothetical protein
MEDGSVADPGCLCRIRNPNLFIPGPNRHRIPDQDPQQRTKVFLTQKIIN